MGLHTRTNPRLNFETSNRAKLQENIESIRKENELANYGVVKIKKDEPLNLDILMETGTGKTFTFIDTIYSLNRDFGLAKFIVLVPSNAIRAGAIKNLEITKEYFQNRYQKQLSVLDYSAGTISNFILNRPRPSNHHPKINCFKIIFFLSNSSSCFSPLIADPVQLLQFKI